jgi:fumarate reductase iron-sulfur subunit
MSEQKIIEIEVLRYRPEEGKEPFFQSFQVPFTDDMSVLQGLQYIKDELDPTLSYRWSCRMAICGSCSMMINGKPNLSCHTFLRNFYPGKVTIEPLNHFPIERDLVINADKFMGKLEQITPYLVPKNPRSIKEGEHLQTPEELEQYEQFSDCINCMLCYSACPQYGLNENFVGPGLISIIHRYNKDSRDGGQAQRMEMLNSDDGVWSCTAVGYCSEVCPKHVDPASAVNVNKINSARDYFLRFFRSKS